MRSLSGDTNHTILLVDDEDLIRSIARDILESMGYRIFEAANGQAAVDFYFDHPGEVDLVIMDMAMPILGGRDAFLKMKERVPDVKVILATGYTGDAKAKELLSLGVKGFIEKPFKVEELAVLIRQVLDNGRN